ncbi:MAG: glutamate 5-kinase [Dehalococcoidia bacterium]|nr:glutamate 5-kinase [Dehalococcoidia bacterium]
MASSGDSVPAISSLAGAQDRPRRVVVKVGTTLLTGGHDMLDRDYMAVLASQLIATRRAGWEVVLVTSGAIAAGRARLTLERGGKDISGKQMLAAVGQSLLMRDYDALFSPQGTTVAQTLLTKRDLRSRVGYLNARNTLLGLLDYGVLPIVNENDVVAVDELLSRDGFGDNDTLSAMVASLVDAGLLILLTDIEGLYTADPRDDPAARLVRDVYQVDKELERLAGESSSDQGTGGMRTKLEAARIAITSGITVQIAPGKAPNVVPRLLAGDHVGTRFHPATSHAEARQRWILSALGYHAAIHIDPGAVTALVSRGRSLLPVGVRTVQGPFQRGETVAIVGPDRTNLACGLASYASDEIERIKGQRSSRIASVLGHTYGDAVVHRNNLVLLPEATGSVSTEEE